MGDPDDGFECRVKFNDMLQNLTASNTSIEKAKTFALDDSNRVHYEILYDCIQEKLTEVGCISWLMGRASTPYIHLLVVAVFLVIVVVVVVVVVLAVGLPLDVFTFTHTHTDDSTMLLKCISCHVLTFFTHSRWRQSTASKYFTYWIH
jgi:hypothetical protein